MPRGKPLSDVEKLCRELEANVSALIRAARASDSEAQRVAEVVSSLRLFSDTPPSTDHKRNRRGRRARTGSSSRGTARAAVQPSGDLG